MNPRGLSRRGFLRCSAALAAGAGFAGAAGARPPSDATLRRFSLREAAAARKLFIGSAVGYQQLSEQPYYDTLRQEFNFLTPENAMKWAATQPQQGQYTFSQADAIFHSVSPTAWRFMVIICAGNLIIRPG